MLVVTRYRLDPADPPEEASFLADASAALRALVARPGCLGGTVGRAIDDPRLWTLTTEWESVGAYRRALSAYEVKLVAVPLMYRAVDEPTAFEPLLTWSPGTGVTEHVPALAPDAGQGGPGRRGRAADVTPDDRSG